MMMNSSQSRGRMVGLVGALLAVLGCVEADDDEATSASTRATTTSRCSQDANTVDCRPYATATVNGRTVEYQVPLGTTPSGGWPVVIMFQGSFHSAAETWYATAGESYGAYYATATVKQLLDNGYAVLTPEDLGSIAWETNLLPWCISWPGSDDDNLMTHLFAALNDGHTFGPSGTLSTTQLYAAGISSGGYMTSRMAYAYQGKFKALAIESASYARCNGPAMCGGVLCAPANPPSNHPPTLFLHGQQDTVVPIGTMHQYRDLLNSKGLTTRTVEDPNAGHQWLSVAPTEVLNWFNNHQ